ncbi:MAG: methionyl-tRNA formyltransferase [Lachnospiraceae bacterium]|nr:methionyl-tRNA formyltransferase [Lachnospiraceae bacterium]
MRTIFIGTSELAVPALNALKEHGHEILAVITQPDRGSGRGKNIRFSPVKEEALKWNLPILQPEKIRAEEVQKQIQELNPDLFVVASYGQKIPQEIMELAPYGCINIHPSLLPKYRGAAPVVGPILNGDVKTGVSIMRLAQQLDAGNVLAQEEIVLDPKETVPSLEPKLAALGAKLLLSVIEQMENGTVEETAQTEAEATYIRQITKEEGKIDFSYPAEKIERMVRAYAPWPSAYTYLDNKTFKIWAADAAESEDNAKAPGTVVYVDKKNLHVQCGEGVLALKEVQIEGKKRMTIEEFLRGKKIETGMHFG